jgi:hypothetical protein
MLQSHAWKQTGSVALWRYTENQRNYPGWHLSADDAGCASLIALLDAFAADGNAGTRTLSVTRPTSEILAVPNNRSASCVAPDKLLLSFSDVASQWSFPDSLDPAELTIGADWLPKLRKAIAGIPHGEGDFSIGLSKGDSLALTFWWQVTLPNDSFKPSPLRGSA